MPAAGATVGLTDRIFTRIAAQETLAVPQSAFLMELSQVAAMLRHATSRCSPREAAPPSTRSHPLLSLPASIYGQAEPGISHTTPRHLQVLSS